MDQIEALEKEIIELRKTLNKKERQLYEIKKKWRSQNSSIDSLACGEPQGSLNGSHRVDRLPTWAIERYSRQILLPDIGVKGQEKLCAARVLIVGAGGLGCPAAMYLAGAGVGEIGIVDYDTVDLTNLHRQVLHGESDQNMDKVASATCALRNINSRITVTPYNCQLDSSNALEIASKYDIVLDCSDNVPTRYLLNDVCVLAKLPLVSGSALKMEGQITIYGYRADNDPNEKELFLGPCYRCVFPAPPPAAAVGSCSANGVAGPVPGVIGALQALEAIKYIVGHTHDKLLVGRMTLFDGEDASFRTVRLRARNAECAACSNMPSITRLIDYETFCKARAKEKKRQEACLKSRKRREEKVRRMTGQSYMGFRIADGKNKWVQDVPKSERRIGPPCATETCHKRSRKCSEFTQEARAKIFNNFWNNLNWSQKKELVRSLVDNVPPKRRRCKFKGDVSRKGDSKLYHLSLEGKRLPVCRIMFMNTFGIKEGTVRWWLEKNDTPKKPKQPIKALNVETYIDNLPKLPPKCQYCRENTEIQYINLDSIKNVYQLFNQYVRDMKVSNTKAASRKTFTKVVTSKNVRIFKGKNDTDICDIVKQHNVLPSLNGFQNLEIVEKELGNVGQVATNFYYNADQW